MYESCVHEIGKKHLDDRFSQIPKTIEYSLWLSDVVGNIINGNNGS